MRRGFSLLEFLIVLGILGFLLALATPNYLRWRAQAQLDEAARSLAWTLQQARADAKRTNATRSVRVYTSPPGWAVGNNCASLSPSEPTFKLSGLTLITNYSPTPVDVVFTPPYGTTDAPLKKFTLKHARYADLTRSVHVIGVTGKVVVR